MTRLARPATSKSANRLLVRPHRSFACCDWCAGIWGADVIKLGISCCARDRLAANRLDHKLARKLRREVAWCELRSSGSERRHHGAGDSLGPSGLLHPEALGHSQAAPETHQQPTAFSQ